jgi:NADH pyrophosphatase NudC (nudix superfamily)
LARGAAWPDGLFSLLTGFLEEGESPESAVVREVGEELGLGVKRTDFIGHFPLRELNQLVIAYACHGEGILKPNHEISETRILSRSELVEYDFGPLELTREIVAHWLRMGTRRSRL